MWMQIFLAADCLIMGVILAEAVHQLRAHRGQQVAASPPAVAAAKPADGSPLSPELQQQLTDAAQARYEQVVDHSATTMQHDLDSTDEKVNRQIEQLVTNLMTEELERYRKDLEELRTRTTNSLSGTQTAFEQQQAAMQQQLSEHLAAEKQRLKQQLDTKLNDAISAFLVDTLQHNVDLGAQSEYLLAMLDEHKDELAREVLE